MSDAATVILVGLAWAFAAAWFTALPAIGLLWCLGWLA